MKDVQTISFYPPRKRLLAIFTWSVLALLGCVLLTGLAWNATDHGWLESVIFKWPGIFSLILIGAIFGWRSLESLRFLLLGFPSLQLDDDGFQIRNSFGQRQRWAWTDVLEVTVTREIESYGESSPDYAEYIQFIKLDSAATNGPSLKIPGYFLDRPLPEVLRAIKQFTESRNLLSDRAMAFANSIGLETLTQSEAVQLAAKSGTSMPLELYDHTLWQVLGVSLAITLSVMVAWSFWMEDPTFYLWDPSYAKHKILSMIAKYFLLPITLVVVPILQSDKVLQFRADPGVYGTEIFGGLSSDFVGMTLLKLGSKT